MAVVAAAFLAAALLAAAAHPLHAQDRMVRRYAAGQGFNGAPVTALAQDGRGFLWIGGQGGLHRYDGTEFRRWAAGQLDAPVLSIAAGAADRLVALTEDGALFEVTGDSARAIPAALPAGRGDVNALAFDGRRRLWLVRGGRVGYLEVDGAWRTLPADAFGGEPPRFLRVTPKGDIAIATASAVWRVESGGRAVRLLDFGRGPAFAFLDDGSLAVLDTGVRVLRGGNLRVQDPFQGDPVQPRPVDLAQRGGTLWASYDRFLVALRPGRTPELIGPERGVESGGPLLVDREGSLWLGTFTSLLQFPEPETRIWNERSGLVSQHTRFVGRSGDALLVTTWQGAALLDAEGGPRSVHDWFTQEEVCDDASGRVWLALRGAVGHAEGERLVARYPLDFDGTLRCARDAWGGAWLATGARLFQADRAGLRPADAPPLPDGVEYILALLHDSRSRLWLGAAEMVCRGDVIGGGVVSASTAGRGGALAGEAGIRAWRCDPLPGSGDVLGFYETPGGDVWIASSRRGVLHRRGDAWVGVPGNELLPTRSLLNLIPSPAGGVWVLGHGVVWRVEEGEADGPWRVRERLGEWHGLPVESGRDLHEDPDGTLWITTSLGVIEVPASARVPIERPPPVALVQALVDEEPVGFDGSLRLPYRRNRLELRFAVLSFRDPGRLRYQVRLSEGEPWRDASGRPWFRWIDLPARSHRAQLRASLDGEEWTARPASFAFRVRPPWYRNPWVLTLCALGAWALLWLGYRARVRYLLGLERERTRIAMDLHDEMGSGLGSIGILSGLLAHDGLEDGRGRELARRIARTAEDIGGSLSDIIWSLDARPATLAELASRLAESGVNLLEAQGIAFRTDFPERWPSVPLPTRVRRNLLLIGLEALHNAARHAGARTVTLGIHRSGGRRWELRVTDDGSGFDPPSGNGGGLGSDTGNGGGQGRGSGNGGGHGLGTMRRRAGEIGGSIDWESRPEEGTTVAVRFPLSGAGVRLA